MEQSRQEKEPLVEITEADGVKIDLRYATADNFTGEPIYRHDARCYLNKDAAEKLRVAVNLAAAAGYKLMIYDAFRPTEAQQLMWDHTPDPDFLADPKRGSPHSRGAAVDLVLCDADFKPLEMGTAFDEFDPKSHHGNTGVSVEAQRNRFILMGLMTSAGWDFYRNEWWHYQLFNAREKYPLYSDTEAPSPVLAQRHKLALSSGGGERQR